MLSHPVRLGKTDPDRSQSSIVLGALPPFSPLLSWERFVSLKCNRKPQRLLLGRPSLASPHYYQRRLATQRRAAPSAA